MAVVSISRIQQRRGKANSGTGLPQLASGEFGWAVDTQELYIGNGSVSEGAPAVGNTRILTQLDIDKITSPSSIFGQLAYVYKSSGAISNYSYLEGSGYTDNVYADVPLNWVSGGNVPISNPIANITVSGGIVTSVVLIFAGIGTSINAVFNDAGVLGAGSGFQLRVTSVTNSTGTLITKAVKRTIQSRLDDRVNSKDFGTVGDGVVNDTQFLQNSINQLFYNAPQIVTSSIDGILSSGNNTVLCAATTDMVGAVVTAANNGIPYGTTIVSVVVGISFVMTNLATIDGSTTLSLTLAASHNVDYNTADRVILEIPPGTYRITNTIYVPSYATIVGAGNSSTIIYFDANSSVTASISSGSAILNTIAADNSMVGATVTGPGLSGTVTVLSVNPGFSVTLSSPAASSQTSQVFEIIISDGTPVFQYINDISTIGSPGNVAETTYINQPRYITLKNLKITTTLGSQICLQLDSARNCFFENVSLAGSWNEVFSENSIGIRLTALSKLVTCQDNIFNNIQVNGVGYGVYSDDDIANNMFSDGYMTDVKFGFALGTNTDGITVGQQYGPTTTKITKFNFNNVKHQAINLGLCSYNTISDINLVNVGNDGGASTAPLYPQIYISNYNNIVERITSDRTDLLSPPSILTKFIPSVAGKVKCLSFGGYKKTGLTQSLTPVSLFKLPMPTDITGTSSGSINYQIDYIYTSTTNHFVKSGTLYITLNVTSYVVAGVDNYSNIEVVDEYNYTGLEDFNRAFAFKAKLVTSSGTVANVGTLPFNIIITYTNNITADSGSLTYSYIYNIL